MTSIVHEDRPSTSNGTGSPNPNQPGLGPGLPRGTPFQPMARQPQNYPPWVAAGPNIQGFPAAYGGPMVPQYMAYSKFRFYYLCFTKFIYKLLYLDFNLQYLVHQKVLFVLFIKRKIHI